MDVKSFVCRANKQIAEVRTKLGTEVSALQVQLRREQLKVQSLEKNLEQKVQHCTEMLRAVFYRITRLRGSIGDFEVI